MDPNQLPPNMGVNYGTLANLQPAQSVVPGGNPAGNIGTASQAGFLGMEAGRRDGFIQQAAQMAALDAQNKGQESSEYMAGAPGRSADISVNNSLSQGRLNDVGSLLGTQDDNIQAGALKAKQGKIMLEMQKLSPYVDLWANSDADTKDVIKKKMKEDGIKIGQKDISDIPDDVLDHMMQSQRNAEVNSVGQTQKLQVEKTRAEAGIAKIIEAEKGRADVARITAASKEKIAEGYQKAKLKVAEMAKTDPKSTDQRMAILSAKKSSGDITDAESDELMALMEYKLAQATARNANAPPQPNPDALPKIGGKPLLTPPVTPQVPGFFKSTPNPVLQDKLTKYKTMVSSSPDQKEKLRAMFKEATGVDPETMK